MESVLYFVICSIVLSLTILASFYLRYKVPTKDNNLLIMIVWVVTISNILDLITGLDSVYIHMGKYTAYFLNTLYLLGRLVIIIGYTAYVILCTDSQKVLRSWVKALLFLTNIYGIVLIVGNLKYHWIFEVDRYGNYNRGDNIYLMYLFAAVFGLYSLAHLFFYGKVLDWSKRISLYVFIILPYLAAWVQYQVPGLLIEGFGLTVALLWIYLNVPRTDRMIDSGTGALNQYAFSKKIDTVIGLRIPSYFMLVRIHDKNALREKYGLEAFKKLIREITVLLCQKLTRENVYYLREARFALTIPQEDADKAKKMAEDIIKEIGKTWKIYGTQIEVNVVGAFVEGQQDVDSINDIYNYLEYLEIMPRMENCSLYEGKHLDITYMKRYDEIERAIDRALQQTNFEVYYQPIFGVKEGRVVAAEALLRMLDDDMGVVSPEEFIPIAEKNGKIVEIGHFVLEKVCQLLQRENMKEHGIQYIEINLSIIECMQKNLPEELEKIIKKYNVDESQINLEITETALANNIDILSSNMEKISKMGVTFSLDDYGTGYSTITYMMMLPFRIVKIDKSILWSSFENERAMIALCASINMIKDMEMEIVVEGVETKEMVRKLKELKCDYLQGYYYSKPLPEEEFMEYLVKQRK